MENKTFVQSLYDAFKEGDIDSVIDALDDRVRWTEARGFPTAGTYNGPDEVREGVFGPLVEAVPDFQAIPDVFIAEGDKVVTLGTYTGTHAETEATFEARFAHLWVLEDEAVVRFEQFVDTVPVQEAFQGQSPL